MAKHMESTSKGRRALFLAVPAIVLSVSACSDRFEEDYRSSTELRQRILSESKSTLDFKNLIVSGADGVCLIPYTVDPKYLPIVSGVQLTDQQVYFPAGDQYLTLVFWNKNNWQQAVFKSSELQFDSSITSTTTYYDYCVYATGLTIQRKTHGKFTFLNLIAIEGVKHVR